ncbi:hypothetical protein RhiJN_21729 [Ceratobasidium sp. AG-Ba]|nr:hypothetical protein RhiJN_20583 [Ceratobasidium sp. AG-Ba]QRV93711.1 hypothetical protein RhiJN_21729 [Ceratobasidium sp. AG-Ba]
MKSGLFSSTEREYLLTRYDGWASLSGSQKFRNELGDLQSPKDQYIDETIAVLFQRFPTRDISQHPSSESAFSVAERDTLHSRIKQLFYNEKYKSEHSDHYVRSYFNKFISVLSLFKQRYDIQIIARRNQLTQSKDPIELLAAYNRAVKIEYETFQQSKPDEYAKMKELVDSVRLSANSRFEELNSETKKAVLDILPGYIASTVKEWSRRTGAHIVVSAIWVNQDGHSQGFDYASRNCASFIKSTHFNKFRDSWEDWLIAHKGPSQSYLLYMAI